MVSSGALRAKFRALDEEKSTRPTPSTPGGARPRASGRGLRVQHSHAACRLRVPEGAPLELVIRNQDDLSSKMAMNGVYRMPMMQSVDTRSISEISSPAPLPERKLPGEEEMNCDGRSTKNDFGGKGWLMIVISGLCYFFFAGSINDGLNIIVGNFAGEHGLDYNTCWPPPPPPPGSASWAWPSGPCRAETWQPKDGTIALILGGSATRCTAW